VAQHYASFLVRCWRSSDEEERIKIEHIQSGESVQVETLAAALVWIDEHGTPVRVVGPDEEERRSRAEDINDA
jgi:hypothetical protein